MTYRFTIFGCLVLRVRTGTNGQPGAKLPDLVQICRTITCTNILVLTFKNVKKP